MALADVMVASRFSHSSAGVSNYLEELPENRNGVEDDDDMSDYDRSSICSNPNVRDVSTSYEMMTTTTSMAYLPKTVVLCEFRHNGFEKCVQSETCFVAKWRPQGRMRTACVGLALCLNISVPPPDVIKISPCARLECWVDPSSMAHQKALETIGMNLNQQYERWQPKARYKLSLDPTVEEIKKLCATCRKTSKVDRVLFHYNGHGVPKPCLSGDIYVYNKDYTIYVPLPIKELDSWLGSPSVYVFDCSAAELIVNAFIKLQDQSTSTAEPSTRDCILLAACEAHETLPQSVEFPADIFTSCLTTPVKMALRWFHPHSLLHESFDYSMIDKIPGRQTDRKTLLGELNWIFTAVTDTIAWNVLPHDLFQRLYRQDLLVASLFRNFLLAERIMRSANCSPVSFPRLPPTHQHHMWDAWDMAAELLVSQLPTLLENPDAEFQSSSFFAEQLTAFEVWLDHGSDHKKPPEQLPIVLQVLLSQAHRFRALILLGRFMDMGPWAVDLALSVGIFPYTLKLLQTNTPELRQILVFIWTKILALDKVDLVKDGGHIYFIKFLDSFEAYPEQRAMAAFVLAVIVDGHKRGQEVCSEAGLVHVCLNHLQGSSPSDAQTEPLFLQWICLCLAKLWEDYSDAQILGLQADAPGILAPLLLLPQPEVRAAAVFALSTLLDFGFDTSRDGTDGNDFDNDEKVRAESAIIKSLLDVASDGSPLVRSEVAVALSRFSFGHKKHLKSVAAAYCKPQSNSLLTSLPSFTIKGSIIVPSVPPSLRLGNDNQIMACDGRVSTSSPLTVPGMRHGSPLSDSSSSLHSDGGGLTDSVSNGVVNQAKLRKMDNSLYLQCVLAACTLAKDPSPRVTSQGKRLLSIIGIEQVAAKSVKPINNNLAGLARSSSWFELTGGGHMPLNFRTPPVSPPRASYLTGMRRVSSLEFRPHQMSSTDSGLADPFLSSVGPSGASECSILQQSTIFSWSCGHFSKPLLTSMDDNENIVARREEIEKLALHHVVKCQHSSISNFHSQIASWDTKFETGTKAALMHPFSPVVIASDENEMIRVWNYEDATSINSFSNHNYPAKKGVSKICLVNELDESLLLVASNDGHIRIWKDYTAKGQQKLVTAFVSVQDHRTGVDCSDAIVDWQQQSGYLFASGDIPSIMAWDLDREQLVRSISFASDSRVAALAASQVHGGQFAVGFIDGCVRLYDIRSPEMLVTEIRPNMREVERVVGIGFQPGLEPAKIVSATAGSIRFFDTRSTSTHLTISAHRGSLTTLAVHRHAPLIASGSSKQLIKVFNLEGDQLGVVRYHPTFMGQKIGSVSSLNFHPYKVLLAAGASDSYVSIYGDDDLLRR